MKLNATLLTLTETFLVIIAGDLDIFVATDRSLDFTVLANYLGAAGLIVHGSTKASFAIRRDGTASDTPCVLYMDNNHNQSKTPPPVSVGEYAQVDVCKVRLLRYAFNNMLIVHLDLQKPAY